MNKQKFILKAIEDGWTVSKHKNTYVFKKKHYNIKEYFDYSFIHSFLKKYS
jgi:hypothetical protein